MCFMLFMIREYYIIKLYIIREAENIYYKEKLILDKKINLKEYQCFLL